MSQRASLQFDYDAKYDVLYVALGDRDNSYGDDSEAGIIYLRDIDTDELTGVTGQIPCPLFRSLSERSFKR